MKRIILSMSLLLTIAVMTASASADPIVNEKVQQSFEKEFSSVKFVEWNDAGDYLKATFILWGLRTEAYFTPDGKLQGCARTLFYNQLPLSVMNSFDKEFTDADVLEVIEISNASGTFYKLTFDQKKKRYEIKADTGGNITEIKKK